MFVIYIKKFLRLYTCKYPNFVAMNYMIFNAHCLFFPFCLTRESLCICSHKCTKSRCTIFFIQVTAIARETKSFVPIWITTLFVSSYNVQDNKRGYLVFNITLPEVWHVNTENFSSIQFLRSYTNARENRHKRTESNDLIEQLNSYKLLQMCC